MDRSDAPEWAWAKAKALANRYANADPPPTDTQIRLDVTTMLCQELGSPPDPVLEFYIREVSQMSNEHREKLRQKHLDMQ
jgi:hypothetical protein